MACRNACSAPAYSRDMNSALPFSSCAAASGLVPMGAGSTFFTFVDWFEHPRAKTQKTTMNRMRIGTSFDGRLPLVGWRDVAMPRPGNRYVESHLTNPRSRLFGEIEIGRIPVIVPDIGSPLADRLPLGGHTARLSPPLPISESGRSYSPQSRSSRQRGT